MSLPDPRQRRGRRHDQTSVLAVAICAVLCGACSYVAIAEWAERCEQGLLKRLGCRRSPLSGRYRAPSEPTIRRVLQSIDGEQVDQALMPWLRSLGQGESDAVALDGKTLRGAHRAAGGQVHLLGAVFHGTGVVIGQREVEQKSNEIPAAPLLLGSMEKLRGLTITADALHTQRELADFLVEKQAAFCFTVKDNQPTLKQDLETLFEPVSFPPSARNDRQAPWPPGGTPDLDQRGAERLPEFSPRGSGRPD
jgi:hypothetical protein